MGVKKVGDVYYVSFEQVIDGKRRVFKKSTKQASKQTAKNLESRWRTRIAERAVGWEEGWDEPAKAEVPSLKEFIENRFLPWAEKQYGEKSKTFISWYRPHSRKIAAYDPSGKNEKGEDQKAFASLPIDQITNEDFARFRDSRVGNYEVSSINRCLGMLRRIFMKATEWGVIPKCPKVTINKKNERKRTRTVTRIEEQRYLAACPALLYQVHQILFETGMRPTELYHMRWEDIFWTSGPHGILIVRNSKTEGGQDRYLPLTPTVREILEARFKAAGKPVDAFIFPADTKVCTRVGCEGGHIMDSSLRKQQAQAWRLVNQWAKENGEAPIRPFDLYIARHTFLTRLGATPGMQTWQLAEIAGHTNLQMSKKYVHPDLASIVKAYENMKLNDEPTIENRPDSTKNSTNQKLLTGKVLNVKALN
jgi:integrase